MSNPELANSESDDSGTHVPELKVDSLKFGLLFALLLTGVQRVVGLVRGILLCRYLPEDQLGQWSLTWSYLMLIAPLAVLGLPGSFNRYVEHYRQSGQLKSFLTRITLISVALTVLFTLVMYWFSEPIAVWLFRDSQQQQLVMVMALALVTVVAFNFGSSLIEALRQVRLVTVMRFMAGLSFAVLAIAMLFVWEHGTEAVTIGFAASCVIGLTPAIWYLSRNWNIISASNLPLPRRSMWSRLAPFAAWLWIINLVSNLYELADRNMLLHLAPVPSQQAQALVGQYHSGRIIPLVLVGLAAMLGGILMSYMTASWLRGERQQVSRQLRWTVKLTGLGFTIVGTLILIVSPVLFDYVLQGKYNDGLAVLPLTLVYCIWYSLMTVGQDYLWCREMGKWACGAMIVGLVVNIGLNLVLIPRMGLPGAVVATATSNLVCLVLIYWLNHFFGWQPDKGVWLTAIAPLCLLLPIPTAVFCVLVISWAGVQYHWIFDRSELAEVYQTLSAATEKLGWNRGINHKSKNPTA